MLVGILMIAGGIVLIAARKSKGGAIAGAIVFGIASILGLTATGIFADLKIWGSWCLVLCVLNIVTIFTQFKDPAKQSKNEQLNGEK